MRVVRVQHHINDLQYPKAKDSRMQDRLFQGYIRNLIRENAKTVDGSYQLCVSDLTTIDQREYLKQYMFWGGGDFNIDDWENIVSFPRLIDAYLFECKDCLNHWLREYADEVFMEDQDDKGLRSYQDNVTGERLWSLS